MLHYFLDKHGVNMDKHRVNVSNHRGKHQGRLNSLKVVGAQLTNKTHFYCEKLNSYEHL